MRKLRLWVVLFFVVSAFGVGIYFRVVHPAADSFSDRFINTEDEGLHSYTARNYYMYKDWTVDSLSYGSIMPVYPRLQILGVYTFGIHSYGFRALATVSSLLSVFILAVFIYSVWGLLPAAVAAVLLSLNYFSIGISRSALPESTMVMFSLLTFIACYKTVRAKKYYSMWGALTAVYFALTFFTKQSGAAIAGVIVVSWIWDAVITKNYRKYTYVIAGFLGVIITCILAYWICVWLPNKQIWYANYKATVGGNRPRRALLIPSYFMEQVLKTALSPFWTYVPMLLLGAGLSISVQRFRIKRKNIGVSVASLAALWFGMFILQMFTMPDKYARFLIPAIIPLIILFSSLFRSQLIEKYKKMYIAVIIMLLVAEILLNGWWGYNHFVLRPTYIFMNSAKRLYKQVGQTKGIYPMHWLLHEPFNAMSTYVMPISDPSFIQFFKDYGTPVFVSLVDAQVQDFKRRAPRFYGRLEYVDTIANYHLYRYRPPSHE